MKYPKYVEIKTGSDENRRITSGMIGIKIPIPNESRKIVAKMNGTRAVDLRLNIEISDSYQITAGLSLRLETLR